MFCEKGVLRTFSARVSFDKVAGPRPGEDREVAIRGVLRNFAKFTGKH